MKLKKNETNKYTFPSRRNKVWREGDVVFKFIMSHPEEHDSTTKNAEFEANTLKKLHSKGVPVPKPISCELNLLKIEYIEGVTLTEYIELSETKKDFSQIIALSEQLTHWFELFYNALEEGCIRGDVNCRNFLVTNELQVFGVDFEKNYYGKKENDLALLCAYILTYEPEYTEYKKALSCQIQKNFMSTFKLDKDLIESYIKKEVELLGLRRSKKKF